MNIFSFNKIDDINPSGDGEYVVSHPDGLSILMKNFNDKSLYHKKILVCLTARALLHKPICKGFFSDIIFK